MHFEAQALGPDHFQQRRPVGDEQIPCGLDAGEVRVTG
jgi:hypothetical protein